VSTQLSRYFTLEELTFSQTAARKGIDNRPNPEQLANLTDAAQQLDRVRDLLWHPVYVLSGFRSPKLNAAIGGSKTSAHMRGEAFDIHCPVFGSVKDVFHAIRKSPIQFDQLILECPDSPGGGWVHVGFSDTCRRQCLTFDGKSYGVA
jgi:hypothetical protein